MLPLAGRCIVTTRPAGQADGLAGELSMLGAEVLNFPVIGIAAADPAPLQALNLADFQLAFFVSPNAVEQAFRIRPFEDWPAALLLATVGPASARALALQGCPVVISPGSGFDSESVLALPEFSAEALAGKRVLLLRGDGGRELLADTLRERGAQVVQVSCYRRVRAALDPAPLLMRFARGEIAALVFSASEGLRFFLEITGAGGHAMLQALPCFAPHPRICAALQEAGATHVRQTGAGDVGIAAGLAEYLAASPPAPSAKS
ncbi:uroporphyrinogen-III synthase [Uliginosibacterium sp. 31-16]|uniref:uroporphyrinogen-III synthase n=1 Tax=Uliginosibacterium sp. 31-16 TaxID=3068315 RepID=UPI0027400D2F|nr:uroporphyrinogen-III synthase [Uliginosibacterium sp. 31-16]MDP5239353.1 uroporphyrinogen-III synthase [Uliginosibacterium sp. 31-16]